MKGKKHIKIYNRDASFEFELNRNITIVRGDSGTGKTTLFNLVVDYTRDKDKSGVNLSSPCNCVAIIDSDWQAQIKGTKKSVVFIDEDYNSGFIKSKDFARIVGNSDNYYVLFTREDLHELPYSIEEIYKIKTSGKFHSFEKIYISKFEYGFFYDKTPKKKEDALLTEDSKAGYQFYKKVLKNKNCIAAGANSKIYSTMKKHFGKKLFIVADGAAFGSEIDKLLKLEAAGYQFCLYLPESFEWVILKSGLIKKVKAILENPSEHIESRDFISWERFFTDQLEKKTDGTYLKYSKSKINVNYLNDNEKRAILAVLPEKIRE